jgi:hypothetical protein
MAALTSYAPLPGEFVTSAIRRGQELLGEVRFRQIDHRIKKIESTITGEGWQIALPDAIGGHPLPIATLYENTLQPLASALSLPSNLTTYVPSRNWKICTKCVKEDTAIHGSPYIHVRHLPKSVKFCSRHAVKLHEACPACETPVSSHSISSLVTCSESFPSEPSAFRSLHHDYAVFIKDLMNFRGEAKRLIWITRELAYKYIAVNYKSDFARGYDLYKGDLSKIFGMDLDSKGIEHHSFDLNLILAFFCFRTAEAYISFVAKSPGAPCPTCQRPTIA